MIENKQQKTSDNVLLCDGNSLYARAFYAAQASGFEDDPVEIAHGMLFRIMSTLEKRVTHTLFAWDGGQKKDKERTERPPEYDIQRTKFRKSLEKLINAINVRIDGYEADDIICTACHQADQRGQAVIILSGDKDLTQLALPGQGCDYYCLNQKQVLSRMAILSRWKVKRPSQIALALAIIGDPGDCIPGIKGWGPKKVEKLFEHVDPGMDFKEAMDALTAHMPPKAHQEFLESLELTLLQPDIPDVPEPNVVTMPNPSVGYELTTGKATNDFLRLRIQYVDTGEEDAALISSLENENWDP